jgi:hypothetical protein
MNTKFIKSFVLFCLLFCFCSTFCSCTKRRELNQSPNPLACKEEAPESSTSDLNFSTQSAKSTIDASEIFAGYKFITSFSKQIQPETGLILRSYGANHRLPKDYPFKNEVVTLTARYILKKTQKDTISLDEARVMLVSLIESILKSINADQEIRPYLEIYPFTNDLLYVSICFEDENYIDLGTGISGVYFTQGKIKYEWYDIQEYTGTYPARGKHYFVHEETYPEALEIVQKSGTLTHY